MAVGIGGEGVMASSWAEEEEPGVAQETDGRDRVEGSEPVVLVMGARLAGWWWVLVW